MHLDMLKKIHGLFFEERANWNIGLVDAPIEDFLNGKKPEVQWIGNVMRKEFHADPFGIVHHGKLGILYENYDYERKLGEIYARVGDRNEKVMDLEVHASYPFLIEEDGEIYCVPETNQANEVAIYKALDFPWKWKKVQVLFKGKVSDATFLKQNGMWFCFYTLADSPHSKLYIRYAKDLFGEWKEHKKNPVKNDIKSSRPAGSIFVHDGKIYRPAQDCSKTYGGTVRISEIKKLSASEFKEIEVTKVEPYENSIYKYGLHTISKVNGMTLIDGKKYNYRFRGFKKIFQLILKKIWS